MCAQREEEYDRKENIILGSNSIENMTHGSWKVWRKIYELEKNRIIEDKQGVAKKEETERKW